MRVALTKKGWERFRLETRYPHLRSEGLTPRRARRRWDRKLGREIDMGEPLVEDPDQGRETVPPALVKRISVHVNEEIVRCDAVMKRIRELTKGTDGIARSALPEIRELAKSVYMGATLNDLILPLLDRIERLEGILDTSGAA